MFLLPRLKFERLKKWVWLDNSTHSEQRPVGGWQEKIFCSGWPWRTGDASHDNSDARHVHSYLCTCFTEGQTDRQPKTQTDRRSLYYSNCEASALVTFSPADVSPIWVSLPPHTLSFPTTPSPLRMSIQIEPPSIIRQSHTVSAACQTQMVNGNNNLMDGHVSLHAWDAAYQTPPAISTYPVQRSSSLLPFIPLWATVCQSRHGLRHADVLVNRLDVG